jgi:hypothetical protein
VPEALGLPEERDLSLLRGENLRGRLLQAGCVERLCDARDVRTLLGGRPAAAPSARKHPLGIPSS